MADFPALPLFTDAFIADTLHLNAEQTGAYLMLLMCAWRSPGCVLPDDDAKLAKFARLTPRKWAGMRDEILAFWTLTDEGWTQKRLRKERDFVHRQRELQSRKGKLGGRPKALKDNDPEKAAAFPRLKPDESRTKAPTPTPTPIREDTASAVSSLGAADAEKPTAQERASALVPSILEAAGIDVATDPRSVTGYWHGSASRHEIERWLGLGLTDAEVIATVAEVASRLTSPPRSLRYFTAAIQDAAGRKAAPPLGPTAPAAQQRQPGNRPATIHDQLAAFDAIERRRAGRAE